MVSNNSSSLATEKGCNENSKVNEKKYSNLRNIRNCNGKEYNLSSNNIKNNILPSLENEDEVHTVKMGLADDINDCKAYNKSSCDRKCCNKYNQNEDEPSCGRLCRARQKRKEAEAAKSKKKQCECDYCRKLSCDASNYNRKRKRSGNDEGCGKKGGCCCGGGGFSGGRGTSNRCECEPKCECKKCCPSRCCESCETCCGPECCESCESCCGPNSCKPCCGPESCKSCCGPESCKSCCGPKSCKSCCGPKSCKTCCEPKCCKESKCCERNCALSYINAGYGSRPTCCKTPSCTVQDPNRKSLFRENSQETFRKGIGKISKKTSRAERLR